MPDNDGGSSLFPEVWSESRQTGPKYSLCPASLVNELSKTY